MPGLLRQVRWYVSNLMGDNAYERYVARHAVEHPGHPPMPERQWWRERSNGMEKQVRCC